MKIIKFYLNKACFIPFFTPKSVYVLKMYFLKQRLDIFHCKAQFSKSVANVHVSNGLHYSDVCLLFPSSLTLSAKSTIIVIIVSLFNNFESIFSIFETKSNWSS